MHFAQPRLRLQCAETQSYVEFINELTGKNFKDYKEMYAGVPFLDVEDISDMVYWLGTSRAAGKFNGRDVARIWEPFSASTSFRKPCISMLNKMVVLPVGPPPWIIVNRSWG